MRNFPRAAHLGIAVATLAAIALAGCQPPETGTETVVGSTDTATVASAAPSASGAPAEPSKCATGPGNFPDVCTLLSKPEVTALTGGKSITQVDPDGLQPDAPIRHCQWQLSGARLAVQLSPTTATEFGTDHPGNEPVSGLGDGAHFFSDHLFVRKDTTQIDIYASTSEGTDADRLLAKAAAAKIVPQL
jgi:hypothetical protein